MTAQRRRLRYTLLTVLALALVRPLIAVWLRAMLPDAAVSPEINYAASILQSLLLFALPGWLLLPAQLRSPKKPAYPSGWGALPLLAAVLARLVATPLNHWWAEMVNAPVAALPVPRSDLGVVLLLLAAVVLPAVAEELFFRGAVLGNLLQNGSRMQALLLTTVMFALMHGNLAGLPGHLLISLLLSVLMLHSGRLVESIAAHLMFNLLALMPWDAGLVAPWMCAAMLCGLVGWMLSGSRRSAKGRLPATECLLCAVILMVLGIQYLM